MRVQEKHVDDTLERDTRPKGEKQSRLTMSEQRCALVLLYKYFLINPDLSLEQLFLMTAIRKYSNNLL
jgi:hypothetical protein